MSDTTGFIGAATQLSAGSQLSAFAFLVRQILTGKAFAALVQVKSVTNAGGIVPVGTVSVQPLVDQVDGQGNRFPHGTVFNVPYFRLQGGANAIILDPVVGDIGLAVISDRDISAVKSTKARSAPGSSRQNSHSDSLYFGGFLNGTPTQYVAFASSGITMLSPTKITLQAPEVDIVAANAVHVTTGAATFTGTLTSNGANISSTHEHGGVQAGGSLTGPPV